MTYKNQKSIKLHDKEFVAFIDNLKMEKAIKELADRMSTELSEEQIVFLCILNGSFMFAGELFKHFENVCHISFVKLSSYSGTATTGDVKEIIGLNESIEGKTVVVVEDIVDTGETIEKLYNTLMKKQPKQVKIATMLFKPDAYRKDIPIDYIAINIPNKFVVGFGLDYNGYGRNLKHLYQIIEP